MKNVYFFCLLLITLFLVESNVFAQSSVQLFGTIDDGITWVNNKGGHSLISMQDSIQRTNVWGIQGTEDLGGGQKAIFRLESNFSNNTGALASSGIMFTGGWVGLRDDRIGQVTAGRQYDFMVDMLKYFPCLECGIYTVENADFDRAEGDHLSNTIQFRSKDFLGFKFGAMYGFGQNAAGTTNLGRSYSFLLTYSNGPFSFGAVTTNINGSQISAGNLGATTVLGIDVVKTPYIVVDHRRIVSVGASYKFNDLTISSMYSNINLELRNQSATDQVLRVGLSYLLTPSILLSGMEAVDKFGESRWYSTSASAGYFFSVRTNVYVDVDYQKASGANTVASIWEIGPSSTNKQLAARVGFMHRF